MEDVLLPILGIVCAVGMPAFLAIMASYMLIKSKHKERMAMIERGTLQEEASKPERMPNRYSILRNGIFMVGLSIGVIATVVMDLSFNFDDEVYYLLLPVITIMFGGLSFILYFFLSRRLMEKEREEDIKKGS